MRSDIGVNIRYLKRVGRRIQLYACRRHMAMRRSAKLFFASAIIISASEAFPQQSITPEDIISRLGGEPQPGERLTTEGMISSLSGDPAFGDQAAGKGLFENLQKKAKKRSFTLKDRQEVETFSISRPKVDIEVYFDYNSAEITQPARSTLDKLGLALQAPRL